MLLQVWDTGVGIPADEQQRIFEEFYQVAPTTLADGSSTAQAQQRKGLGLGLAIVKRLADLMGAPLAVRSQPGRGTVFTPEPAGGQAAAWPGGACPAARRRSASRSTAATSWWSRTNPRCAPASRCCSQGWGATIDQLRQRGRGHRTGPPSADPAQAPPDLLIVDYRLEQGRNGVDAIVALRQHFGVELPAIIVTGSTMTGHEQEAQDKNFHLLIKPVVPNKLRAMIAFKLGVKPG